MKKRATGAQFISSRARRTTVGRRKSVVSQVVTSVCSILVILGIFASTFSNGISSAFAAEPEDDLIQQAFDAFGIGKDTEGFAEGLDKAEGTNDEASFGYILNRVFSVGYMNKIDKGVVAGNLSSSLSGKQPNLANPSGTKLACATNATGAGTLVYSNCDVPNIFTEFVQDAVSIVDQSGPVNAEQKAASNGLGFGLPKNLPGKGEVPIDPNARNVKYTGLELLGYSLNYTSYGGEWDHVKVLTSGRTMANFGFFDSIKLSAHSVVNGITSGLDTAVNNLTEKLSSGDIFGAIGSAYTGFIEGSVAGGIVSVLDTSDLNVFATNSWYRVGFGGTTYGARELTDAELSAQARVTFLSMLNDTNPDDASVDAELAAIEGGPPDPLDAISKCEFINSTGGRVAWGNTSSPPGPSQSACQSQSDSAYSDRKAAYDAAMSLQNDENVKYDNSVNARSTYLFENPDDYANAPAIYTKQSISIPYADSQSAQIWWDEEGTQELETISEWKSNNSAMFGTAQKYGMSCSVDENEANRTSTVAGVKSCWPGEFSKARQKNLIDNQTGINLDWIDGVLGPQNVASWLAQNQDSNNFNAPWNRFVCTNPDGTDVLTGSGQNVRVYNSYGQVNEACGHSVRPPIQGGLFGSGYTNAQNVANDTRHISNYGTILENVIFPLKSTSNNVGNFFLSIGQLFTMISNEVISWTFSPLLASIGIDKIVVDLIEGFRDSLFFPLITLTIGLGGLYILWQTGVKRQYREQAFSLLMIAFIFISGVILMAKPAAVVKLIDEVPSYIETSVVGAIYGVGANENDILCTASGAASQNENGPLGKLSGFTPDAATRTLMCENWRAFVFTPWVYGQWGTGLDNLYANSTTDPNKWNNTNGALVGNAPVRMGAGQTMNNWGLYQADVMATGTSTTQDLTARNGVVSKNFYKIIDAQAGPNNGAGTESKYLDEWAGKNPIQRVGAGSLSFVVSGFGMVTVIAYAFTKIAISFISLIMLIFLPFVFILGLFPAKRSILKNYTMTIIGLMMQRVILVVLLAVFFKVLIGFSNMGEGNYAILVFTAIGTCVMFLMYRKQVMDFAFGALGGERFGGNWVTNPGQALKEKMPKSFKQASRTSSEMVMSMSSGALAGIATGQGVRKGASQAWEANRGKLKNSFRRQGYGLVYGMKEAGKNVNKEVKQELKRDKDFSYVQDDLNNRSQAVQEYDLASKAYSKLRNQTDLYVEKTELLKDKNGHIRLGSDGKSLMQNYLVEKNNEAERVMNKPSKPQPQTQNKSKTTRRVAALKNLRNEIADLNKEREELLAKSDKQFVEDMSNKFDSSRDDLKTRREIFDEPQENITRNRNKSDNLSEKDKQRLGKIDKQLVTLHSKVEDIDRAVLGFENVTYGKKDNGKDLKKSVTDVQDRMKELDEQWSRDLDRARKSKNSKADGGER